MARNNSRTFRFNSTTYRSAFPSPGSSGSESSLPNNSASETTASSSTDPTSVASRCFTRETTAADLVAVEEQEQPQSHNGLQALNQNNAARQRERNELVARRPEEPTGLLPQNPHSDDGILRQIWLPRLIEAEAQYDANPALEVHLAAERRAIAARERGMAALRRIRQEEVEIEAMLDKVFLEEARWTTEVVQEPRGQPNGAESASRAAEGHLQGWIRLPVPHRNNPPRAVASQYLLNKREQTEYQQRLEEELMHRHNAVRRRQRGRVRGGWGNRGGGNPGRGPLRQPNTNPIDEDIFW